MPKPEHDEQDTTFGYPIEEVKTSALDPLAEWTESVMDKIEEDLASGAEDEQD